MSNRPMIHYDEVFVDGYDDAYSLIAQVRRSALDDYMLCPASTQRDERSKPHASLAMMWGTAAHFYPQAVAENPTVRAAERATANYREDLDNALAQNGLVWGDLGLPEGDFHALVAELHHAAVQFDVDIRPWIEWDAPDVRAEEMLSLRVGNTNVSGISVAVYVTGQADLVVPSDKVVMWDWKTSQKAWPARRALKETQPSAYLTMLWPNSKETLLFNYGIYDRSEGSWSVVPAERGVEARSAWRAQASAIALQMVIADLSGRQLPYRPVSDNFHTTRNWYCKPTWCPNWDHCPGKYLFDGGRVELSTPRTTTW